MRKIFLSIVCMSTLSAWPALSAEGSWLANTAKAIVLRGSLRLVKNGASMCYSRVLCTFGFDRDSLRDSGYSGTSDIHKQIPQLQNTPASIAEGTVPQALIDRINVINEQHKNGNYNYKAFKPILIVGPSGSGKTQLAHYVAQKTGCPILCHPGCLIIEGFSISGPENICNLFKRARTRPLSETVIFKAKQLGARFFLRQPKKLKPSILLIDEIGDLAQKKVDPKYLNEDVRNLEKERLKTLDRLFWEINRNPYFFDRPNLISAWLTYLGPTHLMSRFISEQDNIAAPMPHCLCPPADNAEKDMAILARAIILERLIIDFLFTYKVNKELFYEQVACFLLARQKFNVYRSENAISAEAKIKQMIDKLIQKLKQLPLATIVQKMKNECDAVFTDDWVLPQAHALLDNPEFATTLLNRLLPAPKLAKSSIWQSSKNFGSKLFRWFWRLNYWQMAKDDTDTLVIATTDRPVKDLDPLIKETFEIIEIKDLDRDQRAKVLQFHARNKPWAQDVKIEDYADRTEHFNGSKLAALINQAGFYAAAEQAKTITKNHLDKTLTNL